VLPAHPVTSITMGRMQRTTVRIGVLLFPWHPRLYRSRLVHHPSSYAPPNLAEELHLLLHHCGI
jgi:hypothetical protein